MHNIHVLLLLELDNICSVIKTSDASSAGESSEEVKGKKNSEVKRDVRTEQPRARKKVHFNLNHSQIRRKSPGCRKYGNQTNVDG